MTNQSRFQFPGFCFVATRDNSTHQVEVGTLQIGDVVVTLELIRNQAFSSLPFVLARVRNAAGEQIWQFQSEGFHGVGMLAKAGDDPVVALTGRGKTGKVERVISLKHLLSHALIDLRTAVQTKRDAAKFLDREYELTASEKLVSGIDSKREAAEREAAERKAAEDRAAARRAMAISVMARAKITTFTLGGDVRYGFPVLEMEWRALDNSTPVVLVESFGEDGTSGKPIEAFRVLKQRGKNPAKEFQLPVTATKPTQASQAAEMVKSIGAAVIEKDGDALEVQLFKSMDEIRKARAAGLNGGTLVAVQGVGTSVIEVYAVHSGSVDTLGKFQPLVA